MSLREKINQNSTVAAVVAVVVLAIVLLIIVWPGGPSGPGGASGQYFFDLTTNEPFVAPIDALPPIDSPSGGKDMGVRAVYMTCGGCGEDERFLGWLERYTPQAKQLYLKTVEDNKSRENQMAPGQVVAQSLPNGVEMRGPDGGPWISRRSPQAKQIMEKAYATCGGQPTKNCEPAR